MDPPKVRQKRPSVVESIAERLGSDNDEEFVEISPGGRRQSFGPRTKTSWWHQGRAKALIFMLLSTLTTSIYSTFVKKITSISSAELVTINLAFSCLPSAIILLHGRINPLQFGRQWGIDIGCLVVRGAFGVAVDILRVIALKYLPLGDCTTIMFSNPILVALVAPLILKERLLCSTVFAVGLTIAGITLVSQPTFLFSTNLPDPAAVHKRNTGIIIALVSTVVSVFVLIALRALKRVNEHVTVLWAGVIGFAGSLTVTFIMDGGYKMPATNELLFVALAAVFQYVAVLTMIMAFQHDGAARVASVRTTVVVWSYIWQVLFFADPVSWLSIVGAVLVIVAVLIVSSVRDATTADHHAHEPTWAIGRTEEAQEVVERHNEAGKVSSKFQRDKNDNNNERKKLIA